MLSTSLLWVPLVQHHGALRHKVLSPAWGDTRCGSAVLVSSARRGQRVSLGSAGATQLPAPNASAPLSCFLGLSNCKIKQKKRVNLQSGWQGP